MILILVKDASLLSRRLRSSILTCLCCCALTAAATPTSPVNDSTITEAKQIWQLLDYVAVDYGGAVEKGLVISASEYGEMQEFALAAQTGLASTKASRTTPYPHALCVAYILYGSSNA